MSILENLLEVSQYGGAGYQPLVDYETWRVAILRYEDALLPGNITAMQRHDETDEVFVLLAGHCILFLGEGREKVTRIHAVDMLPLKLYNVKRGVWHSHTLSKDASVLIVENRLTTEENSPFTPLGESQHRELVELTNQLWSLGVK
jgi:hypothetical protein